MQSWKYMVFKMPSTSEYIPTKFYMQLNELGEKGWEVVSTCSIDNGEVILVTLKRPS